MNPAISFTISAPEPHSHYFAVEMNILALGDDTELTLRMPVWTPGSYFIREYPQHVQGLTVRDDDGELRQVEKVDKASWKVDISSCDTVTVTYKVYAHELTPRHNHLDGSHGFINCVATCMYPEGRMQEEVELNIVAVDDWEVFCGLERVDKGRPRYVAKDFDELFDTPVEMGPHQYFDFEVRGVPHRFVIWSEVDVDLAPLERDMPIIVEQNAAMFGEIPYEKYVFINHVIKGKWGGLEHRHSSVNVFGTDHIQEGTEKDENGEFGEDYANVLRLLSHEHFHAYHVKRLRPEALGPFDYQRENYTTALWAVEGVTSYFDTYQLLQSGLVGPGRYIELLEKRIKQLDDVPGRFEQSLEESSFDAWIGLYLRNENTRNSTVSYYLKGELAVWLLDLWIRDKSGGERTMADVLRRLWKDYYLSEDIGFPDGAVKEAVGAEAGVDAGDVFRHLIGSTDEIKWEEFLSPAGLRLQRSRSDDSESEDRKSGWLGLETKKRNGRVKIKFIARGGPAEKSGLYAGDEIIAIDGWSIRGEEVEELIAAHAPGDTIRFHILRRKRLREVEATCTIGPPSDYALKAIDNASERQNELLRGWLGVTQWKAE